MRKNISDRKCEGKVILINLSSRYDALDVEYWSGRVRVVGKINAKSQCYKLWKPAQLKALT